MSRHDPIEIAAYLAFGGVVCLIDGFRRMRRVRMIEDTATSRVASAPQGTVELQGHAWPSASEPIKAPVSGRDAAFYKVTVQEYRKSGRRSKWVEVVQACSRAPFFLADGTGRTLILPETDIETDFKRTQTVEWRQLPSSARDSLLQLLRAENPAFDAGDSSSFFRKKLRVVESALVVGSPMYAHGFLESRTDRHLARISPALGLERFLQQMRSVAEIRSRAGAAIRSAADVTVSLATGTDGIPVPKSGSDGSVPLLRSREGQTLYLADSHQDELLTRIGRWVYLRIALGAVLLAAAVVAAYLRFTGYLR